MSTMRWTKLWLATAIVGLAGCGGSGGEADHALLVEGPGGVVRAGAPIDPPLRVVVAGSTSKTERNRIHRVTVALGDNPGNAALNGETTVTVTQGVATFDNLAVSRAGTGYTLVVTETHAGPVTSAAFDVIP